MAFEDAAGDGIYDRVLCDGRRSPGSEPQRRGEACHALLLAKLLAHVPARHLSAVLGDCLRTADRYPLADNVLLLLIAHVNALCFSTPTASARTGLKPCFGLSPAVPGPGPSHVDLFDLRDNESVYQGDPSLQQLFQPEAVAVVVDVLAEVLMAQETPASPDQLRVLLYVCSTSEASLTSATRQLQHRLHVCPLPVGRAV